MDKTVLNLLEHVGFNEKEAAVYHALLELGQGDITDIAKTAGLKRSNIYVLLDKLEKQGYVSTVPGLAIKTYIPTDPVKILHQLQNSTSMFKEMLPFIQALYNRPGHKPRINYFEGKKGVLSVYREINRFPKAYFISSMHRLTEYIPEEVEYWMKALNTPAITCNTMHVLSYSPEDIRYAKTVESKRQQVRFLPNNQSIDMDISIYGNKVAITTVGDPFFVVVIESQILFNSMKLIFDIVWNASKPFSQKSVQKRKKI